MFRISALALSLAAFPALAQPADDSFRRQFDAGDPATAGPGVEYRSPFGREPAPQPDLSWPAANEEMSRLRGHAGHIREPGVSGGPAATSAPATRAASPHHQH